MSSQETLDLRHHDMSMSTLLISLKDKILNSIHKLVNGKFKARFDSGKLFSFVSVFIGKHNEGCNYTETVNFLISCNYLCLYIRSLILLYGATYY